MLKSSVVDSNTLNLDPDPEFWPNFIHICIRQCQEIFNPHFFSLNQPIRAPDWHAKVFF